MRFKRSEHIPMNPPEPEFKPHPKFIAGHVYRRTQGTPNEIYLATEWHERGEMRALLFSLENGNVWHYDDEKPFGDKGRVVLWEDVTNVVWVEQ